MTFSWISKIYFMLKLIFFSELKTLTSSGICTRYSVLDNAEKFCSFVFQLIGEDWTLPCSSKEQHLGAKAEVMTLPMWWNCPVPVMNHSSWVNNISDKGPSSRMREREKTMKIHVLFHTYPSMLSTYFAMGTKFSLIRTIFLHTQLIVLQQSPVPKWNYGKPVP